MSELNYRDKKILGLLEKARNGDLEAFIEAYTFGIDETKFSVKIENGVISLNGCIDPFTITLKEIYEYDIDFYKDYMGLTEKDLDIPEPESNAALDTLSDLAPVFNEIATKTEAVQRAVAGIKKSVTDSTDQITEEIRLQKEQIIKELRELLEKAPKPKAPIPTNPDVNALKELERLEKECAALKNENKALKESALDAAEQDKDGMQSKLQALMTENERLTKLAYYDAKCNVKNNNALNERLKSISQNTAVAEFSICGIKSVNEQLGFKSGDTMIRIVAESLKAKYSPEDIYRVNGDVFFIVSESGDKTSLYSTLATIRDGLYQQEIRVVFDAQIYAGPRTLADLEVSIKKLKSNPATTPIRTNIPNPIPAEPEEEDDGYREEDSEELFSSYKNGG